MIVSRQPMFLQQRSERAQSRSDLGVENPGQDAINLGVPIAKSRLRRRADQRLTCNWTASLVVDAHDQQFLRVSLVVDPERRHWPASDERARSQARHRSLKIVSGKAFDTS